MRYKSKIKCAAGFLVCLALFTGCGAKPDAGPILTAEKGEVPGGKAGKREMLVRDTDIICGTGSEKVFYYATPAPKNMLTGNVRYVDYASGQDVYLSNQVNGDNTGPEDPSYLDSLAGETALFTCGDRLFFLRGGAPSYAANDGFGERALSAIYSMELDGTDRKRIYQGNSTSTLLPVAFADDQFLYCFRQNMQEIELFKLGLDGEKETPVATFSFGTQFLGVWDRNLIVQDIQDVQLENDHRTDYAVYTFNIDTKEQNPGISWGSEKLVYTAVNQDAFYLIGVYDGILERYPFAGGKETHLLKENSPDTSFVFNSPTSLGAYLFIPYYDEQSDTYYNLVVDTNHFSVTKNTLSYYDAGKNTEYEARVIWETEKEFLVITKSYMENAKLDFGDGTETSVHLPIYQMELFEKSDYLESRNLSRQIVRQN